MRSIMEHDGRAALAFSPQERMEQIQAMDARAMTYALTYLAGFAPAVCDAVLGVATAESQENVADATWREAFFGNTASTG